MVLAYTEATTLDATHTPAKGDFTVRVGANANAVTGVTVNAAAKTVTLTLTTAVEAGQAVTVAYTDPTVGNDVNAIQDSAGNDAATLTATAVTNSTPASIDGVPVTTSPGPGGSVITTIPVMLSNRPDTVGSSTMLADIPPVTAADGHAIVQFSVPTGFGLQVEGLASSTMGSAALAELGLRIERVTGSNAELTNAGQVFYATLAPNEPLHVQIIKLTTGAGFDPRVPLIITGSNFAGNGKQAIVLDARSLPSGTVVQVDNIDFIAVVGNMHLIGGAGQNAASGDSAAQWIGLGPEDDVLHGRGGNDTLSGGSGNDRMDGGLGWDTALQSGSLQDNTVSLEGDALVLAHTGNGQVDQLKSVEMVRFDSGASLYIATSYAEAALAHLATRWRGRNKQGAMVAALIAVTLGTDSLKDKTLTTEGLALFNGGWSTQDIGAAALSLAIGRDQQHTAQETVQWLWSHAFGSAGTAEQLQPYVNMLQSGVATVGELALEAAKYARVHPAVELAGVQQHGLVYSKIDI